MISENYTEKATLPFILALLDTSEEALREKGIEAQELVHIYNDFIQRKDELTGIAELASTTLFKASDIHSVRYRIKDPLHLLHKIIRKKQEYPDRTVDLSNYLDLMNDLIGVRVLHLYKDSWINIAKYIQDIWKLKRTPYAYIKEGDLAHYTQSFTKYGCEVITSKTGYRAVHFVIETKPGKQRYYAEIQVKTLFEEGWSEVDHSTRYHNHTDNKLLNDLLQVLSKLAGSADDVSTQIRTLTYNLEKQALDNKTALRGRKNEAKALKKQIRNLPIQEEEKQQLLARVSKLTESMGKD